MHLLFLFIIIILFLKYKSLKLHIDFKSFFKKGFRKKDNKFGVYVYHGKQGKGKTYSAVKFTIDQKRKMNCKLVCNMKSFNVFNDTIYESDLYKIISYCTKVKPTKEPCIVFFDEIFTVIEKKGDVDRQIRSFLSQLRKRHIILVTTAQEWTEINLTFRRYCRYKIDCNMFSLPIINRAYIYNVINDAEKMKWSNDDQEHIAPRVSANFAKCSRSIIESYDTFETIDT